MRKQERLCVHPYHLVKDAWDKFNQPVPVNRSIAPGQMASESLINPTIPYTGGQWCFHCNLFFGDITSDTAQPISNWGLRAEDPDQLQTPYVCFVMDMDRVGSYFAPEEMHQIVLRLVKPWSLFRGCYIFAGISRSALAGRRNDACWAYTGKPELLKALTAVLEDREFKRFCCVQEPVIISRPNEPLPLSGGMRKDGTFLCDPKQDKGWYFIQAFTASRNHARKGSRCALETILAPRLLRSSSIWKELPEEAFSIIANELLESYETWGTLNTLSSSRCLACNKQPYDTKLLRCSACRVAHFCNRGCQRRAWKTHKLECPQLLLKVSNRIETLGL